MEQALMNELEHYRNILGTGDVATRGYVAAIKILEQQIEFLNDFKIKEKITAVAKEDATYGRAETMWEKLPDMISKLHKLKMELGVEYVEKGEKIMPVSPQSVGFKKLAS